MTKMLEGKTIVVAGVGGGLGGQIGRRAFREGANVVLASRTKASLETVVATYMWGPAMENYVKETSEARGVSEEEVVSEITCTMPLGRIPKDEEVAEAVIFFASDRASTITGQHLLVNSGLMMR